MFTFLSALHLTLLIQGTPILPPLQEGAEASVAALAAKNVVTRLELDRLSFTHRVLAEKIAGDADADKSLQQLDLGVWLTRTEFRSGESMPALFVVKNRGAARGLDLWLTLTPRETLTWNGARLHLERTEKGWQCAQSHIYSCGGPPMTWIGERGYLCMHGDLQGAGPRHLPPGEYTLWWSFRAVRSNEVRFRVLAEKEVRAVRAAIPPLADLERETYSWIAFDGKLASKPIPGSTAHRGRFAIDHSWPRSFDRLAKVFAAGRNDHYYPDLSDMPSADECMKVSVKLLGSSVLAGKKSAALEVRLEPIARGRRYSLHDVDFHFSLLVVPRPGAKSVEQKSSADRGEGKDRMAVVSKRAAFQELTLQVDVPDLLPMVPFRGPAKIALVLSEGRIVEPQEMRLQELTKVYVDSAMSPPAPWKGLLATPWMDVELGK